MNKKQAEMFLNVLAAEIKSSRNSIYDREELSAHEAQLDNIFIDIFKQLDAKSQINIIYHNPHIIKQIPKKYFKIATSLVDL